MKKLLLAATVLSCLMSAHARAEDEFYVELGRTATEAEAQAVWTELQVAHKILNEYEMFPNQILQPDGSATYRVQAGPMSDKAEASRVCRRLFRKQASCFVIEGFDPNNAKTFDNKPTSGKWDFLPWHSGAAKAMVAVAAQEPAAIQVMDVAPQVRKDSSKAKVDVAEAIAVPVTEATDSNEVTVNEPVSIWSDGDNSSAPVQKAGWLSIQPFLDASRAQQFWDKLKKEAPESRELNMRVIHPVVSHDVPKVILALGTFPSESAAVQFCHDYIPSSNYLECQFSSAPPQGDDASRDTKTVIDPATEYSLYWAQVLSETSQDKALEKWEKIRTDNDDLLADVRSQITTSLSNPGKYVVRIGPLKSKTKASELCNTLKARKVRCSLVSL